MRRGIHLTIDGRTVQVPEGRTILEAARDLGIGVPALCFREGFRPSTSCMVCVVLERSSGRLVPSCATLAAEGMVIETGADEVLEARRGALELLLSDHAGDCVAPCQRACPAHVDLPAMIRQIAAHDYEAALITLKSRVPLPAALGYICPAPCEKACRRSLHDGAISICLLERRVAEADLAKASPWLPPRAPSTGQSAAIAGAGPTGLCVAYFLLLAGHACTVFDRNARPGGSLRHDLPGETVPHDVLDREIEVIGRLGADFRCSTEVGRDVSVGKLAASHDAVVIATGSPESAADFGVEAKERGIRIDPHTFATSRTGVFAGGSAVYPIPTAMRAVAQGRAVAVAVDAFLRGVNPPEIHRRSASKMGPLLESELTEFVRNADPSPRVDPAGGIARGLAADEADKEAARCLRCDCRARSACQLEAYAAALDARQSVYRSRETGGLGFMGRGFGVRVGAPFDGSLAEALGEATTECVQVCPTGALCLAEA
jgi:ferredoxin